jgi:hypothetical protein
MLTVTYANLRVTLSGSPRPASGDPAVLPIHYAPDLDHLASRLDAAGYAAGIVDEAYNRTLRVTDPDGVELWINGAQEDLYGYRRLG